MMFAEALLPITMYRGCHSIGACAPVVELKLAAKHMDKSQRDKRVSGVFF